MRTPFGLGYRMPAEWEEHRATWMSWPKDPLTFPARLIEKVEQCYLEMIAALTEGEMVELLVDDGATEKKVRRLVGPNANLRFRRIPTADVWTRDYAPIFVRGGRSLAAVKWRFNAWGDKYEELKRDDGAGKAIAGVAGHGVFEPGIVLEGGSVDVNGRGTCLTTEQCLLNPNRNPRLGRKELEETLRDYLGATNVVWLGSGIAGDDTDGHVDDIARFVDGRTVVCMVEPDQDDPNHAPLQDNYDQLRRARNESGERLEVVPIAMPGGLGGDSRLPASYANFYISNSATLVPVFADKNDRAALETLRSVMPGRKVTGIDSRSLVYGLGGIHCVTQQEPVWRARLKPTAAGRGHP